jgi:hypothetical protein
VLNELALCHEDELGSGGIAPPFSTSSLDGDEWSASRPGRFIFGEIAHGTHCIGGWVVSRAGLEAVQWRKTSCLCQELNPGRPAHSPSLYRLSSPGSNLTLPRCINNLVRIQHEQSACIMFT